MRIKIGEYLAEIEEQERVLEQRAIKHSQARGFSTKMPKSFFEYPVYSELKEAILCRETGKLCPRRWEELEIDFNDKNVRYSSLCGEGVTKVSNIHNLNYAETTCIAVPIDSTLFCEIDSRYAEEIFLYIFVQLMRQKMQDVGYREEDDFSSCEMVSIAIKVTEFIELHEEKVNSWEREFTKYSIDFKRIYGTLKEMVSSAG
ncbi:hypothetical protein MNB_SV-10-453 [hydrothermal vent metagenome]|uniref:Uncharacterized protein n=1 Tax=hydrothermal vent metagenome TaxID=652676 RepID=A0A1W1BSV5_9ZZZZ